MMPRENEMLDQGCADVLPAGAGVALVDRDFRFVEVDATFAAGYGLSVAALMGYTIAEVLPALAPLVEPLVQRVLALGEPFSLFDLGGAAPPEKLWRSSRADLHPVRSRTGYVFGVEWVVYALAHATPASPDEDALSPGGAALALRAPQVSDQGIGCRVVAADGAVAEKRCMAPAQRLIARISGDLAASFDEQEQLERLARLLVEDLADCCIIDVLSDAAQIVRAAVAHRDPAQAALVAELRRYTPDPRPVWGLLRVVREGSPLLLPELTPGALAAVIADADYLRLVQALGPRSGMIVPLTARGAVIGTLMLAVTDTPRRYTTDDLALAQMVADRAALVLDNARLFRAAQTSARRVEEERALLDALIATAPIGFALFDRDLRLQRVNQQLAQIGGLFDQDPGGRMLREIVPAMAPGFEPLVQQVFATGEPLLSHEVSGADRIWRVSIYPVRLAEGQVLAVGAVVADITQYRRMSVALRESEAQLRESEARFRVALQGTPIIVFTQDEELRYTWVHNPAFGFTSDEVIGKRDDELLERPEDAFALMSLKQQALATGQGMRQEAVIWRDGVAYIYDLVIEPLRDGAGRIVGLAGATIDITARRQAEDERARLLAEAQANRLAAEAAAARTAALQTVTAALTAALTPDQVATVIVEQAVAVLRARSGVLGLVDDAAAELELIHTVGWSSTIVDAWRRLPLEAPLPAQDAVRSRTMVLVRSLAEAEARYPQLACLRQMVNEVAWATIPLVNSDHVVGALCLGFSEPQTFAPEDTALLDALAQQCAHALDRARLYAAEQAARQQAEAAIHVRDELTALISHDLRNPLAVISGQAQLLRQRMTGAAALPPERITEGLELIQQSARRMSAQIDELLDVARLRAGQPLDLNCRPIDLATLVQQAVMLCQQTTDRHQIQIGTLTGMVCWCDPLRIERALSNLLSNAVKYSPRGGSVFVRLSREEDAVGAWAVLVVEDQGIGVPSADLPHIFESFHRAGNVSRTIRGSGLGLVSARQIVEQHGGAIGVVSVEGQGSTFTIRLPLAKDIMDVGWSPGLIPGASAATHPSGSPPSWRSRRRRG